MRALITGISGFVGSHLADYLVAHTDCQVWGVAPDANAPPLSPKIRLLTGDLRDRNTVAALLRVAAPDVIFHLAAQAAVPLSWRDPWDTLETNIRMQVNLLATLAELEWSTRILVVGSETEYGIIRPEDVPVDEDTPFRPVSPYAVSKIAQDMLGLQYHLSHGVAAIRVRPFPHIGPRQRPDFVTADWARQIAEIEAGRREPVLRVGNLSSFRDYTDVRDVVRAYWLVIERGQPGEVYNVGSGVMRSVQSMLDGLVALSKTPIEVEVDPTRFRPIEVPITVCDASRLRAATGWRPTIPFEQSLRDILDYWRQEVARDNVTSET